MFLWLLLQLWEKKNQKDRDKYWFMERIIKKHLSGFQIWTQFNFTSNQYSVSSEDCSDYSAPPLNHYFSVLYLQSASPQPPTTRRSLSLFLVCLLCLFHFLSSAQSVLSGPQHLDARWTLIRVNENTALYGERMAQAALKSLLTRKWTVKSRSHPLLRVWRRWKTGGEENERETIEETRGRQGRKGMKDK